MEQITLTEFAEKLSEIMPAIMKEFARRQMNELYKGKITLPQFFILEFLHREGELKMTDLAHFMSVTTAAITGIVVRLVRDGYVVRAFDAKDRRIIRVQLTTKGNDLVGKINEQRRQMLFKIFGRITERDRRDYLRILMQIREILTKDTPVAQ